MEIRVIRNVLEANEKLSARLKEHFARHGILTLNLISSPARERLPYSNGRLRIFPPSSAWPLSRAISKRTTPPNV